MMLFNLTHNAWAHVHVPSFASPPPPLTFARLPAGWQHGATSLMMASQKDHVEAVRVLIEKGALIEAADEVRLHSHASTHAR
jgi:hypothetical protein